MALAPPAHQHVVADPEHTQGAAMVPVHQVPLAPLDDGGADDGTPYVQEGQEEARQHAPIPDVGLVQMKALTFQVPMPLFSPHTAAVSRQGLARAWQGGGQKPGFVLSCFPVHHQGARMAVSVCQEHLRVPVRLMGCGHAELEDAWLQACLPALQGSYARNPFLVWFEHTLRQTKLIQSRRGVRGT